MIKQFQGEYRWLSNFWPCDITYQYLVYPSTENAYQAAKCRHLADKIIFTNCTPGQAKRHSKVVLKVEDWNEIKYGVMMELCTQKFTKEPFRTLLLNTGNQYIQEGNTWGDRYWGIDLRSGQGQNNLGKIIMQIRSQLVNESIFSEV